MLDRNADNKGRLRRNAQRLVSGQGTGSMVVTPPITNTGTIALMLLAAGGLQVTSSALAVKLADATLSLSGSGLAVNVIAETQVTGLVTDLAGKVPVTLTVATTGPLAGGGALAGNLTLSIPAATTSIDGYLAATDWNTFNNKVGTTRTISTTAPLTGGGDLSANRAIAIPAASTTVDGYLTHTDWNTFNGKQPAGSYLTAVVATDTSIAVTGSNSVAVALATNSGLQISSGLTHKLADTSLSLAAGGIAVNLAANGGLQISSGLLLKLADTSLIMGASGVGVSLPASSGLIINPAGVTQGLALKPADTSLILSASGVAISPAANGGLQVSSGVLVRGFRSVSADPGSPANADHWYNTTTNIAKVQQQGMTASLPLLLVAAGQGAAVANSTAFTALNTTVTIPANYWQVGRTLRVRFWGNYVASGASPTLVLGAFADSANTLGDGPTISLGTSGSGRFYFEVTFTCLATGSVNTIRSGGYGYCEVSGVVQLFVLGTTLSANTANSMIVEAVAKWSVASVSNSVTGQGCEISVIG